MTCHALRLWKLNWCKRLLQGESGAKGVEWYDNHHWNLLTSIFLIHERVAFPCYFLCKWSNWHSWNSAHKKMKVFPRANLQMLLREQCLESMVREPKYLGHFWLGYIRMLWHPKMRDWGPGFISGTLEAYCGYSQLGNAKCPTSFTLIFATGSIS